MDFLIYDLKLLHTHEHIKFKLLPEALYDEKMGKSFIYCWLLQNTDNTFTPMYIGQTTAGKRRWQQERTRKGCVALYNGIQYYKENLIPCIIQFVAVSDLVKYEQLFYEKFYTDSIYNGYNIKIPNQYRRSPSTLVTTIKEYLLQGKTYDQIIKELACKRNIVRAINLGLAWADNKTQYPINKLAGKSTFKTLGKTKVIGEYDEHGKLINTYDSILKAAKATNRSPTTVKNMCELKYGFFRYDYKDHLPAYINIIIKNRPITGKIWQYDLSGKFIASFNSVKAAAKATGIARSHINGCVLCKELQAGGFLWKRVHNEVESCAPKFNSSAKTGKFGGKPIMQLSLDNKCINKFKSVNEAARQTGFKCSTLAKAAREQKKAYGYFWKYL